MRVIRAGSASSRCATRSARAGTSLCTRRSNRKGSQNLGAYLPEFADRIKQIQARLWDLLPVVRNNVYHPAFAGSYSLKYVLPALVPSLTYADMEIANGQDAGLAWESLVGGSLDQSERDRIRKALLDYCGQDTQAMVRLLDKLKLEAGDRFQK
jgi:hypothetical protein